MVRRSRYSAIAILFHWSVAILILANIWLGWRMGQLKGLEQFTLFQLHKSIGISVLLLSVLRLAWRLAHPAPAYPAHMSGGERLLAGATHWLLYGFMFLLPLTGWIIVSASLYNLPTSLFKTVPWPHIGIIHGLPMTTRKLLEGRVGVVHEWLAWTLLALAALHIAAAIKHHLFDRDDVLARMLPLLRSRSPLSEI
jgi:cytochrome b561